MAKRYVRGDVETRNAMREIAKYVSTPATQAARAALRPVLAATKENARESDDSGALRRSLTIKPAYRTSKLRPSFRVGPDAEHQEAGRRPVRYAHLVEFGHVNRDGSVTPGTRFMTRAFEATAEMALKLFGEKFGPAVEKRAAQIASKARK